MPDRDPSGRRPRPARVAIVDDHRLVAVSVAAALRSEGLEAEAPWAQTQGALLRALVEDPPTVAVVDRDLGPLGAGGELIEPLVRAGSAVVVVSAALDDVTIGRCLATGALACVEKSAPLEAMLTTVTRVARGERVVTEADRRRLIDEWRRWAARSEAEETLFRLLTPREAWVLGQLMEGRSVRAIAGTSYVAEGTIRAQVHSILSKLGVRKQLEAVALAVRTGWTPPGPTLTGPFQPGSSWEGGVDAPS